MMVAICLMLHDWCKYSPFIFPLFDGVEVDEGLEFITSLASGGSKSIDMDVGANGGTNPIINLEVDEVVRLLVPLIKLCQH
jgi:hypothetical protein